MNEEKKLDDEALENVSGGAGTADEQTKDKFWFICNCFAGCYYENHGGCPYGSKKNAFSKVGAGNKCPKKI